MYLRPILSTLSIAGEAAPNALGLLIYGSHYKQTIKGALDGMVETSSSRLTDSNYCAGRRQGGRAAAEATDARTYNSLFKRGGLGDYLLERSLATSVANKQAASSFESSSP
jgi:hypothetical protein